MDLLFYISILFLILAISGFFYLQNKKKSLTKIIQEQQKEIDKNADEIKSPEYNYDHRYETEQKLINAEIEQSKDDIQKLNAAITKEEQANYMKNVFLTNVSNEIRNPLNGILGFANLLKTEMAHLNRDDLYDFSDSISQSGESLLKILNDIIDISSIEAQNISFEMTPCKLKEIINESISNYKNSALDKGIEIICDNNFDISVLSDKETLIRILNSVIDNSVRFTDKGYIRVSVTSETDYITVKIKDTGVGIDPSYISMVFEPYRRDNLGYSNKYQGAGLSLPLAKKALNLMKNNILIESQKGLGTTVIIQLKEFTGQLNSEKPIIDKPKEKADTLPWYQKNVLLVEDDKINQILFTKLLAGSNNLVICGSGEDALDKVSGLSNDKFKVDFVLMDINLPGEYNGITLMHKLKQDFNILSGVPFIAQTAYAMSNEREKLLNEGFDEYISKPIKKTELENVVQKVLNL